MSLTQVLEDMIRLDELDVPPMDALIAHQLLREGKVIVVHRVPEGVRTFWFRPECEWAKAMKIVLEETYDS